MLEAFQRLCGGLPEPSFLLTPQGDVAAANAAACDLVGLRASEIAGRNLTMFSSGPPEKVREFVRMAQRSRELLPGAMLVRGANGEVVDCRALGGWAGSENGKTFVLLRLTPKAESTREFRALSERIDRLNAEIAIRKRVETQLYSHKEWLRTALSSIGDAVMVTDREGRVNFLNPIAETLTGWSYREAEGLPVGSIFRIVNESSRQTVENPVTAVLSQQAVVGLANHTVLISKNGTERPIDDSAAPIRDENGEVIGAVLVFRDMTERRRHDLALQVSHRRLQQMNDSLKQFAYAAAHDLKEPLRSVSIYSELLGRRYGGKLDEKANEFLAFVNGGARRMQALVDDLFRFTQAADTLELPLEVVDCNQVLHAVLENLSALITQTGAVFTYDPLPPVSAHTSPLVQVFQNLIENAIKYRRSAERPVIHIGAERLGSYWRFSIRDNGIGISRDYHRLIFGVFKRLSQHTPGSGIGLAICERVVERYGGRVWVESEVGAGSTFHFTLPEAAGAESTDAAHV